MKKTIKIPIEYSRLFDDDWREAGIYGGRFSLKSHTVARMLLIKAREKKTRVACFREFQSSIAESSHQLLSELIAKYDLTDFKVTNNSIVNTINESDFIFKGLWNNEQSIKSIEGIDIAWCFIAGTLIDGKPIEEIKVGDYVKSYNHKLNKIEYRKVLKTSKIKAPLKLYKLLTLYGLRYIIGTGEHPIFTENGYIPLKDINIKNNVYEEIELTSDSTLLGWLWRGNRNKYSRKKAEICKKWWTVLLGLREKKIIRKNEDKKPYGQQKFKRKNEEKTIKYWTQAEYSWRKRSRIYKGTATLIRKTWKRLVERACCYNGRHRKTNWNTNKLQNRFGKCLLYVSNRMRWLFTYWCNFKRKGQKEKYYIKEVGLDSIKIQEQRDIKQLGLSDEGNYVYNLEVEVNNNYFANGILVHNCEEAQSISQKSLEVLTPTVRKPKSKIIYTYNRLLEDDPIHQRLVIDGRPDTLIINCNYDIAIKYGWMPEVIMKEIEDDKKFRPALYKHKWLGEPSNLERRIYKDWRIIDEIPHEARLEKRWLDFGYTNDPSAIGDVYYYNGGWILDEQLYQKGMSNKQLADFINTLDKKNTTVVADSAEPKSIDEIRGYGINIVGVTKGKDSVMNQIQLVQDQPISYTRRSVNIHKEYIAYLFKEDKNGRILNEEDLTCENHHMAGIRYALSTLGRLKQEVSYWDRVFEDELNLKNKPLQINRGR